MNISKEFKPLPKDWMRKDWMSYIVPCSNGSKFKILRRGADIKFKYKSFFGWRPVRSRMSSMGGDIYYDVVLHEITNEQAEDYLKYHYGNRIHIIYGWHEL